MKLLTWNIQWGRGADGRVDLDRIIAHAKRFIDFDVLCLQEVSSGFADLPGSDVADQFTAIAEKLPGFTALEGVATDIPAAGGHARRRFGNMVLSRLPVLRVSRHLLPWPADPGTTGMQRMALEATLDTPLGLVRVTTTHLEYFSVKQRRAQIERLRLLHQEACAHACAVPPAEPGIGPFAHPPRAASAILAGDFNFLPDSPDKLFMTGPIDAKTPCFRDAWQAAHPSGPRPPTVGLHDKAQWPGPPFTFDFIFVTEDLAGKIHDVRVDGDSDASDHQPMAIELRI
jgi:endonuclease/exonuclease/phosphatase family metal-dependent hydrolase